MDDLLSEFITETNEALENLDLEVVKLEQNPNDPGTIGHIFRLVHTIKGTCGFLGLPRLESVAHAAENVLGKFRDGSLAVSPAAVSTILRCLDRIKELVAALEATAAEPAGDDSGLISELTAIMENVPATKSGADPAPAEVPAAAKSSLFDRAGGLAAVDAAVELMYRKILNDPDLEQFFSGVDMTRMQSRQTDFVAMALGGPKMAGTPNLRYAHKKLVERGLNASHFEKVAHHLSEALRELEVSPDVAEEIMGVVGSTRGEVLNLRAADGANARVEDAEPPASATDDPRPEGGQAKDAHLAHQSIRVGVDLLEHLMTLVSELVLTRNQLLQMVRKYEETEFKVPLQRLNHVTTDLQEGVMKTRMQPIGNAWAKLPRIVRDLSLELGKKIELQMHGADTELDRQILELIKDPLTHMVRNSADHGLETPEGRVKAGKPETGTITLNAYHEGGHIIIEVSDDGHGIDIERVKRKAIANGLVVEAEIESMTEQQIQQLVFKPGFSTAEAVTSVSGRGVGMDVVRTNIERIGGHVEIHSVAGRGLTLTIKIPLTLAIVSALIVECTGDLFAIPQISVDELVRASAGSDHRIEHVNETPVLRLRNRLLPLVALDQLLQINGKRSDGSISERGDGDEACIVVTRVGTYSFGIIVDRVFDTEEIVVKPVSPILRNIAIYSGNTILGDGSIVMILDPNGIAASTGEAVIADRNQIDAVSSHETDRSQKVALLVFHAGGKTPKAVPLSLVARLEEIERSSIEFSNGTPVVQYRGQLMPLLPADPAAELRETGRFPIIVFTDRNHSMGLIVDDIDDIVEDRMSIEIGANKPGMVGSAVVAGKATDIIDIAHYLSQASEDWLRADAGSADSGSGKARRILLVDDSAFFRNLVTPLLHAAGYDVTAVSSADEALALCGAGQDFDVIVTDIEMPGTNGYELAETIRKGGKWASKPIVALSAHAPPSDVGKAQACGITDHVGKFDRDGLIRSLSQVVASVGEAA